jgi:hypothetical protein
VRAAIEERVVHIVTLALVLTGVDYLREFHLVAATPGEPFAAVWMEVFGHWLVRCTGLIVVISLCERAPLPGIARVMLQALAVIAVALATSNGLEVRLVGNTQFVRLGVEDSAIFAYSMWLQLAAGGLTSWYYAARGHSERMVASLRAAELARQHARKALLESRLEIVKAQVEPGFLLGTLARVQDLYEIDPARADRALDDLIDYLRAALPQLRDGSTTLGREVDLIDAYLRVAAARASPVRSRIAPLTAAQRGEYAPPMVLLPLVQMALDASAAGKGEGVAVEVETTAEGLQAHVRFDAGAARVPDARLEAVRRTLESLFGARATLECAAAGVTATWPRDNPTRTP